jgi:hypothetical protein
VTHGFPNDFDKFTGGEALMARATCEDCMSIDVRRWHHQGLLRAEQHFGHPLTWMGEPTGIGVLVKADAVVLVFRSWTWEGGYGQFIHQPVPVTWTPCAFGGRRPWFRCEAYSGGRYCGRRVALLHSAGGPFACRHCQRLTYESQNETRALRNIRRARKIRMRLGGGFSFAEPFPEKPSRMHWRTYVRLRAAAAI